MNTKALCLALSLTACVDTTAETTTDVDQESRTTSASVLPNKIVLAHLDDAAGANLVQYDQNRLFVTRTDYAGTPVLHHYFRANISQLIVGDFALPNTREHGHDQICAVLADNSMECLAPSDDRSQLGLWFSQGNPLSAQELPIVGDFTGDGADDILAYSSIYGTVRLLSRTATGRFLTAPFDLGNLSSIDLRGKQLYAGEFGQATNRADLLVVDRLANNVRRYDSVDSAGKTTFWWAFTTANNALVASEQLVVANIDGGTRDGLILRDPATGGTRLVRADANLTGISAATVTLGQIPITTHSAQLAAVKLADHSSEPGGAVRDDILFFDRTANTVASIGARHDGTRMTYWWGYTKATPTQTGWAPRQDTPVAIILCKLADVDYTPDTIGLRNRLVERGTNSVRDYLFQISYGTLDIANAYVSPWVTSTKNAADSSARVGDSGLKTWQYIDDCAKAAGVDRGAYDGRVLVVLNDVNVAYQGYNYYGAAVDYKNILDNKLSGITHELLHAFGLNHAHDDSGAEYGDTSDLMGDFYPTDIAMAQGGSWGPELTVAHRDMLGVVPANRMLDLDPVTSPKSQTITLAPVESPEAQGTLMVTLGSGNAYYTLELRRTVGLDANTGVNGVQVHYIDPVNQAGATTLRNLPKRTLVAGDTAAVGAFMVRIDSLDALARKAVVTVTHY